MTAKNPSSRSSRNADSQVREAPDFVMRRVSRDDILAEAIRGLRADLEKIREAHSN
jgi:hypothetical protein